jgi:hypothetical protein
MANVVSNGHRHSSEIVGEAADRAMAVEPSTLEKISGVLADNLGPTLERVQEGIRRHPKAAILSGLGVGILAALVIRRLR